jgi:hypothetical protein
VIPKTIVLVFPQLVLKGLPERENGARMGEIRDYVPVALQNCENTGCKITPDNEIIFYRVKSREEIYRGFP